MAFVTRQPVVAQRHLGKLLACAGSIAVLAASQARATLISDKSFFDTIPTTVINFETDGAGTPITLIQGQRQAMPTDAYSSLGVSFVANSGTMSWVNDGNAAFDAAQTIEGSPVNAIPSSVCNSFTISFSVPVRAFGFFVANNRTADAAGPLFVAKDAQGNVLDSAQFGSKFIHGTITSPNTVADYGFMGIWSDALISSITITMQSAILDDMRFSPMSVPAPGAIALGSLGGMMLLRRKR